MCVNFGNRLPSIRFNYLTGFVFVGGASQRMGCPKASLLLGGEEVLERQLRLLRSVARRVVVVGAPPAYLNGCDVPVVPDTIAGRGPLAGIYTALLESRTEHNLVLGCDLPFVGRRLLDYLATYAISCGSDVTVPRSRDGRLQPLCAVYRRRARNAVRTKLMLGENKISGFFSMVRRTTIPWRELAGAGFLPSVFDNMNTPEDYEYTRKRIEASRGALA
jgi:molybdenum cofactor guanylyltransferase